MKITTWNVNGIRSLKKNISSVLQDFESDVICFQETKVSRSQLPEDTALIDGYTSYFSYPRKQSGYSGVATYCRDQFTPDSAEEELTVADGDSFNDVSCPTEIDFEGRVMITHHLFRHGEEIRSLAVINVYCPRVDPEKPERHSYKLQFCQLLQAKMHELCQLGCSVVIVGDLNIACSVIDHCDPGDEKVFNSSEARQWLKSFLSAEIEINGENIKAVDAFRHFHPNQKEAYTCWNTKTGARQTNYGTRIDYILVSSDLIPLLSKCEILSDYHGSDHCPVSAELMCDPVLELKVQLPSICTRLWPEFTGHQQKLNAFFKKAQQQADNTTNHKVQSPIKNKTVKKNKQKAITSFFKNNSNVAPYATQNIESKDFPISEEDSNGKCDVENITACANSRTENESNVVSGNANQWKVLFRGPPKAPLCSKHHKPCILRTVKKSGPNMGRQFYMCSQPVGASTNPDANCNFFKWVNAPKINSLKTSQS